MLLRDNEGFNFEEYLDKLVLIDKNRLLKNVPLFLTMTVGNTDLRSR